MLLPVPQSMCFHMRCGDSVLTILQTNIITQLSFFSNAEFRGTRNANGAKPKKRRTRPAGERAKRQNQTGKKGDFKKTKNNYALKRTETKGVRNTIFCVQNGYNPGKYQYLVFLLLTRHKMCGILALQHAPQSTFERILPCIA